MRGIIAAAICVLLGACSSIIEGRSQSIMVNTNPSGADCVLYRQGIAIATVSNAPASAYIEKTRDDIWIACSKQGYQTAVYHSHPGTAGVTWANILDGGIGWAIDSATGADNKYESPVNITLVPLQPGPLEGYVSFPQTVVGAPPQPAPTTQQPKSMQPPPVPTPQPMAKRSAPPPLQPLEQKTSAPLPLASSPQPPEK